MISAYLTSLNKWRINNMALKTFSSVLPSTVNVHNIQDIQMSLPREIFKLMYIILHRGDTYIKRLNLVDPNKEVITNDFQNVIEIVLYDTDGYRWMVYDPHVIKSILTKLGPSFLDDMGESQFVWEVSNVQMDANS